LYRWVNVLCRQELLDRIPFPHQLARHDNGTAELHHLVTNIWIGE
jgi:hypothetical protein